MSIPGIKIGIIGLGVVGLGVADVLRKNADVIALRAAAGIELCRVADLNVERTKAHLAGLGLPDVPVCADWREIVNDPRIDIVVELAGGTEMPRQAVSAALANKKTVVTANKDLMASCGGELLRLAEENGTDLFFEASVAGGIPIIQAMKESLAANRIKQLMGILNGTSNYILTQMSERGSTFEAALAEAQALGYAEADPANDVEGYDAARKIAILSSIAFNIRINESMVPVEGIRKISDWDITYAKEFGYAVKLLGIAQETEEGVEVRVHPAMIPLSHPLAAVRHSYNAVFVNAFPLEKAMFYGRGAGGHPTASAVIGDIINASRNILNHGKGRWACTCFLDKAIKPLDETQSKYYIRISAFDRPGVFAAITGELARQNISIDSVIQKRSLSPESAEIVIITHRVRHRNIAEALEKTAGLADVMRVENVIRVEDNLD
ncbi:MAG: homoserine dehydrogenase [Clostridiales bacterium]|nr:homoserine dehydrogenase [Clostridiales bacterium]